MPQERDELVRKGILTPFHKLKGFERRIEEPGSSGRSGLPERVSTNEDFALSSITRAARSISEAAQSRPTTKLLDSEVLPKLEPPTRPFQRLRRPLKAANSVESDSQKNTAVRKKKKRPLPAKKWRKASSLEEKTLEGNGVFRQIKVTHIYDTSLRVGQSIFIQLSLVYTSRMI